MTRFLLLALVLPSLASAGEFHFENFRYGRRALGMAGAVTAYSSEPEASFYNPAGLAMLGGIHFSGSLHFYGFDERRLREGLYTEGPDGAPDLTSGDSVVEPSSSVLSKSFGGGRHVLALSTFLASDLDESFRGAATAPFPPGAQYDQSVATAEFERQDTLLLRGISYAQRLGDRFAAGVTVFLSEHERSFSARRAIVLDDTRTADDSFADASTRENTLAYGLLLRAGVLWHIDPTWSLGAACSTPSVTVYGEGDVRVRLLSSGDPMRDDTPKHVDEGDDDLRVESVLPWSCRVGGLMRPSDSWALTLDVSVHVPVDYTRFSLPADLRGAQGRRQGVEAEVEAETTVNAAIGVEYLAAPRWPLRGGVFSNRTSAPEIDPEPAGLGPAHVDNYGATFSVGYLSESVAVAVGAEYQLGFGHDVVPRDFQSLVGTATEDEFLRVDRDDWRLLFFVSGAVGLAKEGADQLLD